MKRLFSFFLFAALMAVFGAEAQKVYELDVIYQPEGYTLPDGTIDLPKAGDLYMTGSVASILIDGVDGEFVSAGGGQLGQVRVWRNLSAGVHQVSTNESHWVDNPIMFYMAAEEIKVLSVDPKALSEISPKVNGTGDIVIRFSEMVTYSNAYLKVGSTVSQSCGAGTTPLVQQYVNIREAMRALYADGTLDVKGGQQVTLVIEGIKNLNGKLYGSEGTYTVKYRSAPKALMLTKTNFSDGRTFLSYYPQGDPAAKLVFTFDGDVADDGQYAPFLEMGIGNIENDGEYYFEVVPGVVVGNTVSVDLSGVNRQPLIKACGDYDGDLLSVKLCNVYDLTHHISEGLTDTQVGSYPFTFIYREVPEVPIDFEFTPNNGAFLNNASKLNLWLNNFNIIESFEGLCFAYDDGTVDLIPADRMANASTDYSEADFTVAIPERAKTEPVTVSLAGIISTDGYQKFIEARYNALTVLFSTPVADHHSYDEIPQGNVQLRFNMVADYPEMVITAEMRDPVTNEILLEGVLTRLENKTYVLSVPNAVNLVRGYEYQLAFTAFETPEAYAASTALSHTAITLIGTGVAFEYSPVELTECKPDSDTFSAEQNTITATFNGYVSIDAATSGVIIDGKLVPFSNIVDAEADPDAPAGLSHAWHLTVPVEAFATNIVTVHIGARDEDGNTVEGDMPGTGANDARVFSFTCTSGIATVSAADAAPAGVYNLMGVKVAESLDAVLAPGIYIAAGRKVIIR